MVRVEIRVILALGLQLISSKFGIIFVDFYMDRYIMYKFVIYLRLKYPLYYYYYYYYYYGKVKWLKISRIIVENYLYEFELRGKK